MKLEVVVIPVSDVDRAKEFYANLGWRLDADFADGDDWRVIQFTPPGSGCSVIFGKNVTAAAPGSAQGLYLIVSDIEAARDELLRSRRRDQRGVPRRRRARRHGRALPVWATPGQRSGSRASQLPLVRLVQRSGRQRLAAPGGHRRGLPGRVDPDDDLRIGRRSRRALRRAAAAHGEHEKRTGQHDAELAGLVRRGKWFSTGWRTCASYRCSGRAPSKRLRASGICTSRDDLP